MGPGEHRGAQAELASPAPSRPDTLLFRNLTKSFPSRCARFSGGERSRSARRAAPPDPRDPLYLGATGTPCTSELPSVGAFPTLRLPAPPTARIPSTLESPSRGTSATSDVPSPRLPRPPSSRRSSPLEAPPPRSSGSPCFSYPCPSTDFPFAGDPLVPGPGAPFCFRDPCSWLQPSPQAWGSFPLGGLRGGNLWREWGAALFLEEGMEGAQSCGAEALGGAPQGAAGLATDWTPGLGSGRFRDWIFAWPWETISFSKFHCTVWSNVEVEVEALLWKLLAQDAPGHGLTLFTEAS